MDQIISETSVMLAFSLLPDPRKSRNQVHNLFDIIATSILATLCGADSYCSLSFWVEINLEWLQEIDICPNGAPSHDTYERFFRHLCPKQFEACFIRWTQLVADAVSGVIALDGKTIRGSRDRDANPIHMVSAFSTENNLVLGQLKTVGKGKELETFQLLLDLLDVRGTTVTIDAGGCHKVIAQKIREKKGDYVLALKRNHLTLHDEVDNFFSQAIEVTPEESECDYYQSEERTRGREEVREVWACDSLEWLPKREEWKDLRSIVCVRVTKRQKERVSSETRYYLSSHVANAEHLGKVVRSHWAIENQLHWHLDVTFGEDRSRVRKDHGPGNLSILRRATMNILKKDDSCKASLKNKRMKAGCKRSYLIELITNK